MRFIATFQVNYRNILLEVKDVISSVDKFGSFLYNYRETLTSDAK